MFRIDDAFLEEYIGAAECLGGLRNHAIEIALQLGLVVAAADAPAAAAGGRLQHDGITDARSFLSSFVDIGQIAFGAGGYRDAGRDHCLARLGLVAHAVDHFRRGADENNAALLADTRDVGIFGEEAVARMECVATGLDRQIDDAVCVQIASQRIVSDLIRLIGAFHMQRVTIGLCVDRHRANAHLGAGAHDAHRDLASVGYQNLLNHGDPRAVGPSVVFSTVEARGWTLKRKIDITESQYQEYLMAEPESLSRSLHLNRLTLRQIHVFLAVARLNSYSRAAEELALTQPAVSAQIRQLEDVVGEPVFDYVGKQLYLTPVRAALQRAARDLTQRLVALEMEIAELRGVMQGTLNIAVESSAQHFM